MHNFRSSISQLRLVNDLLVENSAGGNGSGIYIAGLNDVTEITHLTIAGAGQSSGQAIYSISGTTSITNTIVASYTVGVEKGNGTLNSHYNVYFDTMTNELTADTSSNNATGNPLFIDPSSGNYRIQPGSSALDSGINAGVFSDIEGAVRPLGADFDRGAYEFPNQAPQVGPISAPVEPVGINVSIEATAPFTDPDEFRRAFRKALEEAFTEDKEPQRA